MVLGRRRLCLAVLILSSAATTSLTTTRSLRASEPRRVEITASRFRFDPAVVEVRQGEAVRFVLHSADTDHGLAIGAYGIKIAIPKGGAEVTADLVATRVGRFPMECSEYCGSGHRRMRGELVVKGGQQ